MKDEIVSLYSNFNIDELTDFFNSLIGFVNKYEREFSEFTFEDSLRITKTFKSEEFFIGTSDYNFKDGLPFYSEKMKEANEQEICHNVMQLIWELAAFMMKEVCPSCQDECLRIGSSVDRAVVYKTCDNCLSVLLNDQFIESPHDIIPATKEQVNKILNH